MRPFGKNFDQIGDIFDQIGDTFDQIGDTFDQIGTTFDQTDTTFDQLEDIFDQTDTTFDQLEDIFDQTDTTFDQLESTLISSGISLKLIEYRHGELVMGASHFEMLLFQGGLFVKPKPQTVGHLTIMTEDLGNCPSHQSPVTNH